jgi:hypothetical protein
MEPTLLGGERFLHTTSHPIKSQIRRGRLELVDHDYHDGTRGKVVRRIVAVGDDLVTPHSSAIVLQPRQAAAVECPTDAPLIINRDCRVPEGHVIVAAENPSDGEDSRQWGAVPLKKLVGLPILIWSSSVPGRSGHFLR